LTAVMASRKDGTCVSDSAPSTATMAVEEATGNELRQRGGSQRAPPARAGATARAWATARPEPPRWP
jgi:hypothetical protein